MKNILKLYLLFLCLGATVYALTYYDNSYYYPYTTTIRKNYYPYYNNGCNNRNGYVSPYYCGSYPAIINTTTIRNVKRINGKLRRIKRMKKLKKLKKLENNLSWINNKNKNGTLTGYSTPITNDIYTKLGIPSHDSKQRPHSINCNQELFTSPSANEIYYGHGGYKKDISGASGKTGVTIIYD